MSTGRFSAHGPLVTGLAVVPLASASCKCTVGIAGARPADHQRHLWTMAVFEQLAVDIQRQVEDIVIHPYRPHGHAVRGRRGTVGEEGVADALRLLERTQDAFAAGQRLAVHAGVKRQLARVVSTLPCRLSRKKLSISPLFGANMRARSSGVTSRRARATSG